MVMMDATSSSIVDVCKMMDVMDDDGCKMDFENAFLAVGCFCQRISLPHLRENNKQDNGLCPEETLAEIRSELMQYGCNLVSK